MVTNFNNKVMTAVESTDRLTSYKAEEKRVFIIDNKFMETSPVSFECDRGDGEKFKIAYDS